jgi:single-strand DNA-binding protein
MLNSVSLNGRLTDDQTLRFPNEGKPVGNFSVAVDTGYGDKKDTSFFSCVLFGKLAETLNQYLTKGKQIGLTGSLRQNRWEKDGQKNSRVEIVVKDIQLLGGKDERKEEQDEQPRQQGFAPKGTGFPGPEDYNDSDDIPF